MLECSRTYAPRENFEMIDAIYFDRILSHKRSIIIYYNNIDYSHTPGYSHAIGDAPREIKKKTCSS